MVGKFEDMRIGAISSILQNDKIRQIRIAYSGVHRILLKIFCMKILRAQATFFVLFKDISEFKDDKTVDLVFDDVPNFHGGEDGKDLGQEGDGEEHRHQGDEAPGQKHILDL